MNNYDKYKAFKPYLGLFVALIFWSASFIFFIVGMSFDTELVVFGKNIITAVSVALALAITIIQVAGNGDKDIEGLDLVVWLASYALGIGTNVYGLSVVLNMNNPNLEWLVAISLGIIIEVSPERQLVKFLKGAKPPVQKSTRKKSNPHNTPHLGNQNHRFTATPSSLKNRPNAPVRGGHGDREPIPAWMKTEEK